MGGSDLSLFAIGALGSIPTLLVMLAGAVICAVRRSRPLRARVLVGIALVIQLFNFFTAPLVMGVLGSAFSLTDADNTTFAMRMALMNLYSSSMSAVVLGLLLWAAFTRDEQPGL